MNPEMLPDPEGRRGIQLLCKKLLLILAIVAAVVFILFLVAEHIHGTSNPGHDRTFKWFIGGFSFIMFIFWYKFRP